MAGVAGFDPTITETEVVQIIEKTRGYKQMYNEINSQFYNKSKSENNRGIFLGVPILLLFLFVVLAICFRGFFASALNTCLVLGTIFLVALISFYSLIIYSVKNDDEFAWKRVWRVLSTIALYRKIMHRRDTELLIQILKEHDINTRPKVLEAIRHYQCLIPRKIGGYSYLLSLFAVCLSMVGIFFQETILNSELNLLILISVLLILILLGVMIYLLNRDVFRYFGENAINERIEMALSEIYMKKLIK